VVKSMTTISLAALALFAAAPLSASAQTGDPTWSGGGRWHSGANCDPYYGCASGTNYSPGFFLNVPGYPYAPTGGNSGGANFPHPGT
jgi:hypothetical protein